MLEPSKGLSSMLSSGSMTSLTQMAQGFDTADNTEFSRRWLSSPSTPSISKWYSWSFSCLNALFLPTTAPLLMVGDDPKSEDFLSSSLYSSDTSRSSLIMSCCCDDLADACFLSSTSVSIAPEELRQGLMETERCVGVLKGASGLEDMKSMPEPFFSFLVRAFLLSSLASKWNFFLDRNMLEDSLKFTSSSPSLSESSKGQALGAASSLLGCFSLSFSLMRWLFARKLSAWELRLFLSFSAWREIFFLRKASALFHITYSQLPLFSSEMSMLTSMMSSSRELSEYCSMGTQMGYSFLSVSSRMMKMRRPSSRRLQLSNTSSWMAQLRKERMDLTLRSSLQDRYLAREQGELQNIAMMAAYLMFLNSSRACCMWRVACFSISMYLISSSRELISFRYSSFSTLLSGLQPLCSCLPFCSASSMQKRMPWGFMGVSAMCLRMASSLSGWQKQQNTQSMRLFLLSSLSSTERWMMQRMGQMMLQVGSQISMRRIFSMKQRAFLRQPELIIFTITISQSWWRVTKLTLPNSQSPSSFSNSSRMISCIAVTAPCSFSSSISITNCAGSSIMISLMSLIPMMPSLSGYSTHLSEYDSTLANSSSALMQMAVLESAGTSFSSSRMYSSLFTITLLLDRLHLYMYCTSPSAVVSSQHVTRFTFSNRCFTCLIMQVLSHSFARKMKKIMKALLLSQISSDRLCSSAFLQYANYSTLLMFSGVSSPHRLKSLVPTAWFTSLVNTSSGLRRMSQRVMSMRASLSSSASLLSFSTVLSSMSGRMGSLFLGSLEVMGMFSMQMRTSSMGMSLSEPSLSLRSMASTRISYMSWLAVWNSIFSLFMRFRMYFKSDTEDRGEIKQLSSALLNSMSPSFGTTSANRFLISFRIRPFIDRSLSKQWLISSQSSQLRNSENEMGLPSDSGMMFLASKKLYMECMRKILWRILSGMIEQVDSRKSTSSLSFSCLPSPVMCSKIFEMKQQKVCADRSFSKFLMMASLDSITMSCWDRQLRRNARLLITLSRMISRLSIVTRASTQRLSSHSRLLMSGHTPSQQPPGMWLGCSTSGGEQGSSYGISMRRVRSSPLAVLMIFSSRSQYSMRNTNLKLRRRNRMFLEALFFSSQQNCCTSDSTSSLISMLLQFWYSRMLILNPSFSSTPVSDSLSQRSISWMSLNMSSLRLRKCEVRYSMAASSVQEVPNTRSSSMRQLESSMFLISVNFIAFFFSFRITSFFIELQSFVAISKLKSSCFSWLDRCHSSRQISFIDSPIFSAISHFSSRSGSPMMQFWSVLLGNSWLSLSLRLMVRVTQKLQGISPPLSLFLRGFSWKMNAQSLLSTSRTWKKSSLTILSGILMESVALTWMRQGFDSMLRWNEQVSILPELTCSSVSFPTQIRVESSFCRFTVAESSTYPFLRARISFPKFMKNTSFEQFTSLRDFLSEDFISQIFWGGKHRISEARNSYSIHQSPNTFGLEGFFSSKNTFSTFSYAVGTAKMLYSVSSSSKAGISYFLLNFFLTWSETRQTSILA